MVTMTKTKTYTDELREDGISLYPEIRAHLRQGSYMGRSELNRSNPRHGVTAPIVWAGVPR